MNHKKLNRKLRMFSFVLCISFILLIPTFVIINDSPSSSPIVTAATENLQEADSVMDEAIVEEKVQQSLRTRFFENLGQVENLEVKFYGNIPGGRIGFGDSQILLMMDGAANYVTLSFENALSVTPQGTSEISRFTNYFLGERGTYNNIRSFSHILYEDLWPGIDLIYEATADGSKYEFHVSPGADPNIIRIRCNGQDSLLIDSNSIKIEKDGGFFVDDGLKVFQESGNINAEFCLYDSQTFGVDVGSYDRSKVLVIDPLLYSTYVGHNGMDWVNAMVYGGGLSAYVTGYTISTNFPTNSAYDSSHNGNRDCFVFKLDSAGSLLYSTFIGGGENEEGNSIAVSLGCAYVAGYTLSSTFPTVNAYDSLHNGGYDCFVLKLNSTGNGLDYSTFVGHTDTDHALGIALDSSRNAYVTGRTYSSSFPTVNAYDSSHNGYYDCFVFKLNSAGDGLLYSTFVGGSFTDEGKSIAIDSSNAAFVTGITSSSDFPAVNSFDDQLSGSDCFVFKLNSAGDGLLYSTFVGGSGDDEGESITIDIFGDSYVTGSTESTDFPMENPYDDTKGANSDCFVFKLNSTGNGLIFSTYIGGDGDDYGASITIDGFENVYVTGSTTSSDFPTSSNGLNTTNNGLQDIFVLLLDPNGILQYSTYLGGSGYDQGFSIDVGDEQHIYVAGRTSSSDFPTVNAYDSSFGGVSDCFVLKIQDITPPSIIFEHIMPASPDEDDNVDVYVSLQDGSGYSIVEAKISYSIDDQVSWTNVSMSEYIFIIWEGTIPQQDWNTTVYFKVYARDIISNWAVSSTWSYYVKSNDVTAPTISTSYDPTSPNDLTDVTVTADVSDPLGVPEVVLSYSIDGQSTWDNITMTFQSGTDWAAIIPQQTAGLTVHFKVYARDHANNWGVSSVDSFVVGSTPIIGTDHSPFYPTDADTVTATASVTDSGSATISEVVLSYSTDGQSTWTNVTMAYQSGNDWTANIPQQSWQTTVNYKVYARNDLNHWIISGVTSYDVGSSDVTPPNIDHLRSPTDPTNNDDVVITATVTDPTGINQVILSYSITAGATWTNVTMVYQTGDDWTGTIPKLGADVTVQYKVYAQDNPGNWAISSTGSYTIIQADQTNPDIDTLIDPTSPTSTESVEVIATVTDESGIAQVILSYSTNNMITWTNITMTYDGGDEWSANIPQQSAEVTVHYKVYAEDNAGNWGVSTTEDYTVSDPDTVGPTIGCSQSPSQPTEIDDVIVTATVTDETGVVEAVLEYKVGENTTWEEVIMEQSGAQWSAPIPHQAIGVSVQYRVKARDISNNWATSDTYSYIVEDANPPPTALEVFAQYVPLLTAVAGIITVTRGYIWWKARKNGKSGDYDSIPDGLTRDSDGSLVFSEEPDDGSPLDD